jgi:hypothetical protein
MDNIEEKMKGTAVAGFIPGLLAGTTLSYIRCTEVDFEVWNLPALSYCYPYHLG